ncbi:MAG: transposase [Bryobacterales bacterium]|nr:transposase [Bryobacterales bacterium]
MVARMDALFAIDREAAMSIEDRHVLRHEKAAPLVDALREELLRLQKNTLPKSALGQAVSYTLTLWKKLTVFLEHPVVELSNNLAENSMRGVALGRNYAHVRINAGNGFTWPISKPAPASPPSPASPKPASGKACLYATTSSPSSPAWPTANAAKQPTSPPPPGSKAEPDRVRQDWGCSDACEQQRKNSKKRFVNGVSFHHLQFLLLLLAHRRIVLFLSGYKVISNFIVKQSLRPWRRRGQILTELAQFSKRILSRVAYTCQKREPTVRPGLSNIVGGRIGQTYITKRSDCLSCRVWQPPHSLR